MSATLRQLKNIFSLIRTAYAVDLRALGLMRIGVAMIVLADLLIRCGDMEAHYTDAGCWPLEVIHHSGWKNGYWSLHALNGSMACQVFLFSLHFLLAFFLLSGYQTRFSGIAVFILTISLHNRNLFIQQAGDDLLRLTLLWGIFLPWSAHYSIDALKEPKPGKSAFFPSLGYLLLIASVYLFSVLLKSGEDWHSKKTAVYYALSLEQLRLPLGDLIYSKKELLRTLTFLTYFIELAIPLLILCPVYTRRTRLAAFVLIVILHLTIGLTLYVGLFYLICIVTAIGLLPGTTMDLLERKFRLAGNNNAMSSPGMEPSLLKNCAGAVIILLCLLINLSTFKQFPYRLNAALDTTANALRLDQYWGMFSPDVLRKDGWLVYHGMDSIGRQWDLRLDQDYVDYRKPEHIVSMYKTDRWRKLAENMQDDRFTFLRPLYCRYYLRKWNARHPEKKIALLNLHFMEKENLEDYKTSAITKKLFSVCDDR